MLRFLNPGAHPGALVVMICRTSVLTIAQSPQPILPWAAAVEVAAMMPLAILKDPPPAQLCSHGGGVFLASGAGALHCGGGCLQAGVGGLAAGQGAARGAAAPRHGPHVLACSRQHASSSTAGSGVCALVHKGRPLITAARSMPKKL